MYYRSSETGDPCRLQFSQEASWELGQRQRSLPCIWPSLPWPSLWLWNTGMNFHIVPTFSVLEAAVMSFISRHLNATSSLLAHLGGVKPQWYANTVMDTCFKPWEVSCKTSFSIGQRLCNGVRSLRNELKAKPVIARTKFEWGHLSLCVSYGLPPALQLQRPHP